LAYESLKEGSITHLDRKKKFVRIAAGQGIKRKFPTKGRVHRDECIIGGDGEEGANHEKMWGGEGFSSKAG